MCLWSNFVDPFVRVVFPGQNVLTEPQFDFFLSILNGVGSVADVTTSDNSVISSDGSRVWCQRIGGSEQESSGGNNSSSFPDHADDGTWQHVVNEGREEGSCTKVGIVLFKVFFGWGGQFKSSKVVSFLLESGDDGSNESSLDTVGLDHDVGSFDHLICWTIIRTNPKLATYNSKKF